ncbi:hypothetical protein NDK50_12530 [Paraburkholderia bryophila]|uniref:hypothetical protein n=1 Tax=Paraburkholderia bryophila TaxID=420952 RepID=UPI00234AC9AC|nr:hypothetical protein [Paraburkholderia bryophila]WCM18294.1 hypothetical protein NDK50_12530 [Paraburkholderia bryophila]
MIDDLKQLEQLTLFLLNLGHAFLAERTLRDSRGRTRQSARRCAIPRYASVA